MSEPTVVVVDAGVESETPPAGAGAPQYVTAGELDAKLELLRNEVSASVSSVMEQAWAARDAAEAAADEAAVATAVAVEAAATADEAAEESGDSGEGEGEGGEAAEDETPQPPAKRQAPASPVKSGSSGKSRSYGAGWLSR